MVAMVSLGSVTIKDFCCVLCFTLKITLDKLSIQYNKCICQLSKNKIIIKIISIIEMFKETYKIYFFSKIKTDRKKGERVLSLLFYSLHKKCIF